MGDIAERLKIVRSELKLAQRDMARAAGIGQSTLQKYEIGSSYPGFEAIEGIVKLGFSGHWLITGEGPMRTESDASKRLREIYALLESLDVPILADKLAENSELSAIKADLEALAQSPDLDETVRAGADTALKLAFGDSGAAARAQDRFDQVAAQLRRAKTLYADALRLAEWEPPRAFAESLKALINTYNMSLQDTASHIEALKADWQAEKNKI